MDRKFVVPLVLAVSSLAMSAGNSSTNSSSKSPAAVASTSPASRADFCFIAGSPPSNIQYSLIKHIQLGKGTYGSARQLLDAFAEKASSMGADAIINYSGAQHFGFWPWRMMHPVVRGSAIRWQQSRPDCKAIGGLTLQEMMQSDKSSGT